MLAFYKPPGTSKYNACLLTFVSTFSMGNLAGKDTTERFSRTEPSTVGRLRKSVAQPRSYQIKSNLSKKMR